MQARHRARSGIWQPLQRHRRVSDRTGPVRGSDSLAGTSHGSAPLRAAPFSALQPGPRVSRKRNVQPCDALLPGSSGNRAALFAGAAGAGFAPPHGELGSVRMSLLLVLILASPAASLHSAQTPERFDSGPYKGFTKANIEHIVVELSEPFRVRSIEGSTLFFVDGEPYAKVLFEIRDETGNVRGIISDARGRFRFSRVAPGTYDFKATKDNFQSVTGKIIVSKRAHRTNKIQIKMEVGV